MHTIHNAAPGMSRRRHEALRRGLALATVAIAVQASAQVTLYERENFQGDSFTTRKQVRDLDRFGFNESAASAVVAGDAWERWQLCESARFGGRCVVLAPGQYPTLQAMGLNGRVASVQAMARELPPPVAVVPVRSSAVFYERESFGGGSLLVQDDLGDFSRTGFQQRAASVEVIGGPWELCQTGVAATPCVVLRPGKYASLRSVGVYGPIASARAIDRDSASVATAPSVVFYEGEGFGGRSFSTQGDVMDFRRAGFRREAASVEVVGGWFEACQDAAYRGQCVFLRPGRYPSLTSMGLSNRIASVRVASSADPRVQEYTNSAPVVSGFVYDARRRENEPLYQANVVAVRAVVGPPEQRCWVEREQVTQAAPRSNVPAAIAGALIGGILGHQVGDGRGRDLATVGGAVAGGALGSRVGRDGRAMAETHEVQRCATTPTSQTAVELWDVTYNFRGQEHRVQMTTPPGATITVNGNGEPRS